MRQAAAGPSSFAWNKPPPPSLPHPHPPPYRLYQDRAISPSTLDDPAFHPQASFQFTDGICNNGPRFETASEAMHGQSPFDIDVDVDIDNLSHSHEHLLSLEPPFDSKPSTFSPESLSDFETWPQMSMSMSMSGTNTNASTLGRDPSDTPSSGRKRLHENEIPLDDVPSFHHPSQIPYDGSASRVHGGMSPRSESQIRSDKSERARNAAVQRHSKSKHARKESFGHHSADSKVDDVLEGQKEKNREKNKIAAAKCRAKKRENMEVIESNHRNLGSENSFLKRREQQLRESVAQLRTLALDHQNCHCGVHQYNMHEARKMTHGHAGLQASVDAVCSPNTAAAVAAASTAICRGSRPHSHPDGAISPSLPDSLRMRTKQFPASMDYISASMPNPDDLVGLFPGQQQRDQSMYEYDR